MAEGTQRNLLRCFKCNRLSENEDKYMPPCCGRKVMCQVCYGGQERRIYCGDCRRISAPTRIRKEFFMNILENLDSRKSRWSKGNERENGVLNEISEEFAVKEGTWQKKVSESILAFLNQYHHGKECRPYGNILFLCDAVFKIKQKLRGLTELISIHDILAYQCLFCAHGKMNKKVKEEGQVQVLDHGMNECKRVCCGKFLDRTTLQYEGGHCECNIYVMQRLGIRPATQSENSWRWKLFSNKPTHSRKKRIVLMLNPVVTKMGVKKAHMIVWYLMSQGSEAIEEIEAMSKYEIEQYLWQIIEKLNAEFRVHRPVQ